MVITVLYVDDEPALLRLGARYLEQIDPEIRVTGARCVDDAMKALETGSFDAIVADYQMPDHDGLAFLREVRARHDRLPFILLTGHGGEEVAIQALNLGADSYLQKGGSPRAQYADLAQQIRTVVEQRQVQVALARSEARFRSYFQIPLIGITIIGEAGVIREANRKALEILGRTPEMLQALSWMDLVVPNERNHEYEEFERAFIDPRGCIPREVRIERGDGKTADVVVSMAPVHPDGESPFLVALIEDVTEQRRTLRALEEREAGYRAVVEAMTEGLLIQVDGYVVFMNSAAATILGLALPGEGIGQEIRTWMSPEGIEGWFGEPVNRPVPGEGQLVRADGRTIEVEMTAAPVGFQDQQAVQVVFRDVTGARAQARALAESESRYRAIFERAGEGILLLTAETGDTGRVVAANQAAAACYGRSAAELVESRISEIEAVSDGNSLSRRLGDLEGDAWLSGSTEHLRRDGTPFPVDYSIGLIEFAGSRHVLTFIRDVTERRMAEEAARRASEKLNLLSSITRHDILNQVTALLLYLELSSEDTKDPVISSYVEKELSLTRNIQRLITFTKDYQDLGAHPPIWHPLEETVKEGVRMAGTTMFTFECGEMPYEVYADPLFPRVFTQIAENTAHHAPGATRLSVRTEEDARNLVITCEDDGPGLSTEAREGCFKRRPDGTGLGLCLCRDILSITGIEIREAIQNGPGARFEIQVPARGFRRTG